uniref:Uncharacterized protein n=1 Tax=Aegilops tauschii subsp. strangulata TaxID=200361 RepID=A0A453CW31_AEGTS
MRFLCSYDYGADLLSWEYEILLFGATRIWVRVLPETAKRTMKFY